MRHGDKVNNLGRKKGHRVALLKNLATALILHKRINTTLAKAKALRIHVEPLITKSKENTTHSRRVVFSYLQSKEATHELFANVAPKIMNRPGGYVRIIKMGFRQGDAAEMALIELVDFNEVMASKVASATDGAKRRTRRGSKKATETTEAGAVAATNSTEETAVAQADDVEKPTEEDTAADQKPTEEV